MENTYDIRKIKLLKPEEIKLEYLANILDIQKINDIIKESFNKLINTYPWIRTFFFKISVNKIILVSILIECYLVHQNMWREFNLLLEDLTKKVNGKFNDLITKLREIQRHMANFKLQNQINESQELIYEYLIKDSRIKTLFINFIDDLFINNNPDIHINEPNFNKQNKENEFENLIQSFTNFFYIDITYYKIKIHKNDYSLRVKTFRCNTAPKFQTALININKLINISYSNYFGILYTEKYRKKELNNLINNPNNNIPILIQPRITLDIPVEENKIEALPTQKARKEIAKDDDDDDDKPKCRICMSKYMNIFFYKCGHVFCCEICSELFKNKECPMCGVKIEDMGKLYFT